VEVLKPEVSTLATKPIPPKVIQDCVKRWAEQNKAFIGPWAYDGRNNLYAPKTLIDPQEKKADGYQEFRVEIPQEGKKHPQRLLYDPFSTAHSRCALASVFVSSKVGSSFTYTLIGGSSSLTDATVYSAVILDLAEFLRYSIIIIVKGAAYRLRIKMVGRITMDELADHLENRLTEWPAKQLQALEIVLNSPFINDPRLLYQSRTLFELAQVICSPLFPSFHVSRDTVGLFHGLLRACPNCVFVQRATDVGQGGEAWIGYKQDLRPCQYGLMLTIEPSFSVFYQGKNVVDYCQAVLTKNQRQPWEWSNDFLLDHEQKECSREIKGLSVRRSCLRCGFPWWCCFGLERVTEMDCGPDKTVPRHLGCGILLVQRSTSETSYCRRRSLRLLYIITIQYAIEAHVMRITPHCISTHALLAFDVIR
jgi:hypothetical protein